MTDLEILTMIFLGITIYAYMEAICKKRSIWWGNVFGGLGLLCAWQIVT